MSGVMGLWITLCGDEVILSAVGAWAVGGGWECGSGDERYEGGDSTVGVCVRGSLKV